MEDRAYNIVPNVTHQIDLDSGETLYVNGCFDSLHYWEPLDVHWLRYFDEHDPENPFKMVVLKEYGAQAILDATDLPYVPRDTLFDREHRTLVQALGGWITETMFQLDIDEQVILAQEQDPPQSGGTATPEHE